MKHTVTTRLTTAAFAACLFFVACKKENSANGLTAQEEAEAAGFSAQSDAYAQATFDDVSDNVLGVNSELGLGDVGVFARTATSSANARTDSNTRCVSVSVTPLQPGVFPKTVVLDFGTGCRLHGRLRSGKVITVYTGPLRQPGSSATTTFDNHRIDSVKVEGTHRISNTTNTTGGNNQRQFTVEVKDGKLTHDNGDYTTWNGVRVHKQTEGNGSTVPVDDVFQVTGQASGQSKLERLTIDWSATITNPLVKRFTCRWISKGTVRATRQGLGANSPWVGILEYGDGTCDNLGSMTVNGNSKQITLR